MNSVVVFGQLERIEADPTKPQGYADLVDIGRISDAQVPPRFTLVAFASQWTQLAECEVGDLLIVAGRITCGNKNSQYKITVTSVQRLAFEDDEQPQEPGQQEEPAA